MAPDDLPKPDPLLETPNLPEPGYFVVASENMAMEMVDLVRSARQRGMNDIAHRLEYHITTARRLAVRAREEEVEAYQRQHHLSGG